MTIRSIVGVLVLVLSLCAGGVQAAAITYTINFTGGGTGVSSIGPGSFSYDSMGAHGVIVGPPVTLTGYNVPVSLSVATVAALVFTQNSPEDDDAVINNAGFVTAVSVDSINNNEMLQLNNDNTWSLSSAAIPQTTVGIRQAASGTYAIKTPTVPEPASLALIASGLGGLLFLRRKYRQ